MRESSGVPKIIYAVREQIRIEEQVDIQKLLQDTIQAVKKVAGLMCLQGLGRPSSIYCVLSSPWYASQTRTVVLEKNAPFIFTDKLADSLIQKELNLDRYLSQPLQWPSRLPDFLPKYCTKPHAV